MKTICHPKNAFVELTYQEIECRFSGNHTCRIKIDELPIWRTDGTIPNTIKLYYKSTRKLLAIVERELIMFIV